MSYLSSIKRSPMPSTKHFPNLIGRTFDGFTVVAFWGTDVTENLEGQRVRRNHWLVQGEDSSLSVVPTTALR